MSESSKGRRSAMRRWRDSLYARAALFLVLGAASLVGAVAALSTMMVDESVQRLLGERIDLARTVGVLLEHRFRADLKRISDGVSSALEGDRGEGVTLRARAALSQEYIRTVFQEGAFVLDERGVPLAAVPGGFEQLQEALDLRQLAEQSERAGGMVVTPLVELKTGPRLVLVLLSPLFSTDGRLEGYAGGIISLAATNVLDELADARRGSQAELDLVDAEGTVVASTDRNVLFQRGDHGSVLTDAIHTGRDLRGQCHSCHVKDDAPPERATDVLAFAPLPTLSMGIAVRQPEREALAPAIALRRRLVTLGIAFVSLFVLFAGLSVTSVVRPIKRLTHAVRRLEATEKRLHLPSFGRDEVGQLARALEKWRGRMLDSLDAEARHREALHTEIESTRSHLEALQDLAAQYMLGVEAQGIVEHGLDQMVALLGLPLGVIKITYGTRQVLARRGLSEDDARLMLDLCELRFRDSEPHPSPLGFGICEHGRLELPQAAGRRAFETVVGAHHKVPQGVQITCTLADEHPHDEIEARWLSSLVHHLGISVTNRLLHDQDLERQHQQAQYLHRVLKAQEDERRRVARELHDTVAQDLAALRLEIERLSNRPEDPSLRDALLQLEKRAHATLLAVRRTLLDLRLSVLENMGFLPALQWHLERVEREQGIRGFLTVDGEVVRLTYEMAVTLFRIFQESLQNAVQHAEAEHVSVTAVYGRDTVELTIEDDGHGFDLAKIRSRAPEEQGRGLGLLGMEERARLLGGRISSRPGDGTTISVVAPLARAPDQRPPGVVAPKDKETMEEA